jgi:serine/threonine-protein kinase
LNRIRNTLLDRIFTDALDLTGKERDEFIRDRCRDDPELEQQVRSLMQASEASEDAMAQRFGDIRERLWQSVLTEEENSEEDLSGQRVNAWRLKKRIARGGLATVYLAKRDDGAFDQTVAFKVLRRGLDTDDVVARFRAERQILSALDHPSIARIFDGGALDDGRPYLVLEYVDGLPITSHCERYGVNIHGRVALLIEVLRALHHAHQHLVVHRDVKPSNVLVSAEGQVALLDFGIAKLLDPLAMPGASTMTRTGVSLLTPGYGSPEQRAGETVTTASDIYQVGLVMYELLSGQRPFEKPRKTGDADPVEPSHFLRGTPEYADVQGDLDAIARRAMHTDRTQRYASADEMSTDLRRYLDGLPVIARPDTLRYRLTKLTKRKPWLLPAVTVTVLAVALYVATLTAYSKRIAHEERLAAAAQQFMVDLFRSPDPYAPADAERGREITVVEALAIGERRVRTELDDQPELKASLLASISDVYASLDQNQEAILLREEALALERDIYGARSEQVADSLRLLGDKYTAIGENERAASAFDEQLAIAREVYSADAPELAAAEIAAAIHAANQGNVAASRGLLQQAVAKLRKAPHHDPQTLINALIASAEQHGMEEADAAFAAVAEAGNIADSVFGTASLQAALVRVRLASTMTMFGDYERSEQNFLEAIPVLEARLGKDHGSTLSALNNLGYLYHRRKDQVMAEQIHAELLERQIAKRGPVHRAVADVYQNLAGAITHLGRYDESIPLHQQAYEIYKSVLNEDNYMIAFPLLSIAYAELQRNNAAAAERAAREALSRFEATVSGTFLEGVARCLVGLSLEQQGRTAEGGAMVSSSHELMKTGSIPDPYPALCRFPASQESAR